MNDNLFKKFNIDPGKLSTRNINTSSNIYDGESLLFEGYLDELDNLLIEDDNDLSSMRFTLQGYSEYLGKKDKELADWKKANATPAEKREAKKKEKEAAARKAKEERDERNRKAKEERNERNRKAKEERDERNKKASEERAQKKVENEYKRKYDELDDYSISASKRLKKYIPYIFSTEQTDERLGEAFWLANRCKGYYEKLDDLNDEYEDIDSKIIKREFSSLSISRSEINNLLMFINRKYNSMKPAQTQQTNQNTKKNNNNNNSNNHQSHNTDEVDKSIQDHQEDDKDDISEQVTAGNMNKATENYVNAAKTGNAIVANTAMNTLKYVQAQAAVDNKKKKEKDDVSGEKLKAVTESSPLDFAKKNLENKQENKIRFQNSLKQERANDERKLQAIDSQIEAAKQRVEAAKAADKSSTSEDENISENTINQIEKNALNAKEATKEVESINGEDGIKTADEDKEVLKEEAEKRLIKLSARRFSKMLFNGSSGDALKYFIYGEINNGNREELSVARKMRTDKEVEAVIRKIEFILKKSASGDFTDEDYLELKVLKSKFRQLFYKFKNL